MLCINKKSMKFKESMRRAKVFLIKSLTALKVKLDMEKSAMEKMTLSILLIG